MKEKLKKIILKAGESLKEGFYSNKDVDFKAKKDLVTKYDIGIENFLKEEFQKEFKDFNIIAEESDNSKVEFGNSIIIDPIDGTTNFVNGVPHTAISVGIYKNKEPYIGIVYNPILDEMYEATVGEGALLNGEKIEVSKERDFQKALIATGFPYTSGSSKEDLEAVLSMMKAVLPNCQDIRRLGSASIDLCMVAKGTFDGYYEMNLKPWDVSAGIIILSEAGGKFSSINGNTYSMFEDKYLVATNSYIHDKLISTLSIRWFFKIILGIISPLI